MQKYLLGGFWLIALLNPVFKKYDYGAGFPLVLLFGVLLVVFAVMEWKKKREDVLWEKLFLLIFGVFVMLSFAFSSTKNLGFSEVMAFLSVGTFYWIYAYSKEDWVRRFLKVVAFGALISVLMGYFFYFNWEETRMVGPFFNILYHANKWPNAFALFLLMTWPIFLIRQNGNRAQILRVALVGIVLSALLLTFSRGALIAFCGQLVLLAIYFARRLNVRIAAGVIVAGLVAASLFFGANYLRSFNHEVIDAGERAAFANEQGLTSKQERIDFWKGALELIKEKPWLGWGPWSFRQAYNPIQKTFLGNSDHPHNIFLKIAAENGLVALGAFVAFLLAGLLTVGRRFKELDQKNRDLVYLLGVAVAGAFAHNFIDYNFNFFANLLLLFAYLAAMRSMVVGERDKSKRKPYFVLVLSLWLGFMALDEGSLLALSQAKGGEFLESSRFARYYFVNSAEEKISDGDFVGAVELLDKEQELNGLDARSYYLEGAVYCNEKNEKRDLLFCLENFEKAFELNPMNEIEYYSGYFRALEQLPGKNDNEELLKLLGKSLGILEVYFDYVQNNVHFTAYTPNVEAAAELVDLITPHVDGDVAADLQDKKVKMLEKAEELRTGKKY